MTYLWGKNEKIPTVGYRVDLRVPPLDPFEPLLYPPVREVARRYSMGIFRGSHGT